MPFVHILGVIVAAFAAVAWWELLGDLDDVRAVLRQRGWLGVLALALVPAGLVAVAMTLMRAK